MRSITRIRVGVVGISLGLALGACAETGQESPSASTQPSSSQEASHEPVADVKIGLLYPLSGGAATLGLQTRNGSELAAEIVNGDYDLGLQMAPGEGLPNLGGARVVLEIVDHQGDAELGQSEAERLITEEHVVALSGGLFSSVTQTASQVAERNGIPFLTGETSAPGLTERGFKWFFRTGPHDRILGQHLFDFLDELRDGGAAIETIGIVTENSVYGQDANAITVELAAERGYEVVANITHEPNTTEVSSEVQTLKAANPDVVFQASFTADAILFMNTYKQLDFSPKAILAYSGGFTDPALFEALGDDAQYVITRAGWAPDIAEANELAAAVAQLYEEKYDAPMTENSARAFTGMMALLDAINRAGSTDPEAIRQAIIDTDTPESELIVPMEGIKYGEDGQNIYARGVVMQWVDGAYHTVWPSAVAAQDAIYPRPSWENLGS